MSRLKKIMLLLLVIVVAIQFFRPARNESSSQSTADFAALFSVPKNIQISLQNACYDCHSNSTTYPWYSSLQPMAWMMSRHITDGKAELNFSQFANYPLRRQLSKLKSIASQVKDNEMPLSSYKLMHKAARLDAAQKKDIVEWMEKKADSLSANN